MKKIVFTEEFCQPQNLFPFTLTRPVQDIRTGILTIREKWELHLQMPSFDKVEEEYKNLQKPFDIHRDIGEDTIYLIHGNVLPTTKLVRQVKKLKHGECISIPGLESVVYCISKQEVAGPHQIKVGKAIELGEDLHEIKYPWNIFEQNNWALTQDFELITRKQKSQKIPSSNKVINHAQVFIDKGAKLEHCILNASDGPIFIGKNVMVMEGSLLRGPLAICEGAIVKMGTKIYGGTIGPNCIVGGEIKNSIFFGNSNKAHDGYLGDSVIGEWCNMGAGSSNSNIKNNASSVIVWTPNGAVDAGLKCGCFLGDYSRTAINTSINTGTVIGVSANVYGNGLTPKYIPSFSWGSEGVERYRFDKAIEDIISWKKLKGKSVSESEKNTLKYIFDHF